MDNNQPYREHLARLLAWDDAHLSYDAAVKDLEPRFRGTQASGLPYSPWQLIEHLRIAQHDILDFCRNPAYEEMKWPDDYWPASPEPPSTAAWTASLREFKKDRGALEALVRDPRIQLEDRIPHGTGQTYLREILLAADHAAYHVGQLVTVRRLLGNWPPG